MGIEYHAAAVPISKSHITLFLFNADGDTDKEDSDMTDKRLDIAKEAIEEGINEYKVWLSGKNENIKPLHITLEGVDHFNNSVIFAKPTFSEFAYFEKLWTFIREHLVDRGFIPDGSDESKASSFRDLNPHVTLLKMSRLYKQSRKRKKGVKENPPRKFPKNIIHGMEGKHFGTQSIDRIELLSLTKEGVKGDFSYYFCEQEFSVVESDELTPSVLKMSDHANCCSPIVFPSSSEDSTESDTEHSMKYNKSRSKVAIEKDHVKKSVRSSIVSTLQNKLRYHSQCGEIDNKQPTKEDGNNSNDKQDCQNLHSSSIPTPIILFCGSILTIVAIKILINTLRR